MNKSHILALCFASLALALMPSDPAPPPAQSVSEVQSPSQTTPGLAFEPMRILEITAGDHNAQMFEIWAAAPADAEYVAETRAALAVCGECHVESAPAVVTASSWGMDGRSFWGVSPALPSVLSYAVR